MPQFYTQQNILIAKVIINLVTHEYIVGDLFKTVK